MTFYSPTLVHPTNSSLRLQQGQNDVPGMGVRRNFSRGSKANILLIFLWLLTMQRKPTYTKNNVQCYGNSCIQCFPCKKTLHRANVCLSEHAYCNL